MSAQLVDELVVEGETGLVHRAVAIWVDARPADREAVGLQPHLGHERHVLAEAVIVIDGDITVAALEGAAGFLAEHVPYRRAFAIGVPRAFDLIGGRGCAPQELFRKYAQWNVV